MIGRIVGVDADRAKQIEIANSNFSAGGANLVNEGVMFTLERKNLFAWRHLSEKHR